MLFLNQYFNFYIPEYIVLWMCLVSSWTCVLDLACLPTIFIKEWNVLVLTLYFIIFLRYGCCWISCATAQPYVLKYAATYGFICFGYLLEVDPLFKVDIPLSQTRMALHQLKVESIALCALSSGLLNTNLYFLSRSLSLAVSPKAWLVPYCVFNAAAGVLCIYSMARKMFCTKHLLKFLAMYVGNQLLLFEFLPLFDKNLTSA